MFVHPSLAEYLGAEHQRELWREAELANRYEKPTEQQSVLPNTRIGVLRRLLHLALAMSRTLYV